jgi:hypothetical protein
MSCDQPVGLADLAEAVRQILASHIRMVDGRCRGCFNQSSRIIPHPCTPFDWATAAEARNLTLKVLNA